MRNPRLSYRNVHLDCDRIPVDPFIVDLIAGLFNHVKPDSFSRIVRQSLFDDFVIAFDSPEFGRDIRLHIRVDCNLVVLQIEGYMNGVKLYVPAEHDPKLTLERILAQVAAFAECDPANLLLTYEGETSFPTARV